jgi:hypothetical protein
VAVSFTVACLVYLSGLGMHYTAKLHLPEEQLFFSELLLDRVCCSERLVSMTDNLLFNKQLL